MQRGWKCAHCTFLNQNAPILDPHTKQHKGFCEICEGVPTLVATLTFTLALALTHPRNPIPSPISNPDQA